jgi:hypothetical protein
MLGAFFMWDVFHWGDYLLNIKVTVVINQPISCCIALETTAPKGQLLWSSIYLSVSLLSVFLTVCLSARPSVCLSICLSICLSVHPSCLSICFLSVYPSVRQSVHPFACPFIHLSNCLSVHPSINVSVHLSRGLERGNRGIRITRPGAQTDRQTDRQTVK